jgi:hypothetical protein
MTTEIETTPDVVDTKLSVDEQQMLEQCEAVIEKNMESVFDFGLALLTITTKKLYRQTHNTVEAYMRERFGIAKSTFYQYRGLGQFIKKVRNCGQIKMLPSNEFQVRPILKLNEDAWADAWNTIVDTAPDGKVTGTHATKVVADLLGEQIRNKANRQQQAARTAALPDDIKDCIWQLIEQVRDVRLNNLPKTVRNDLRMRIEGILNLLDE